MELKTYFAQDASGNIMPGATVMVYEAATTTLATGLQDESGSPLSNPFTADSSAKVAFYAPDGLYDITVVGNGRTVTIRAQFVSVDGASVLRSDLAATGGSALVGYDDGTTQDVLDESKPLANYTALRAYTGRATGVRITQTGLAGFFQRNDSDTTSADNGGTIIVDASGRRWKRLYSGAASVGWFGAKGDYNGTIGTDNSAAIQLAIDSGLIALEYPGGNYLAANVTLKSNQFHASKGATLTSIGTAPVFVPQGNATGVHVEGFTFAGAGKGIYQPDTAFYSVSFTIKRNRFARSLSECILFTPINCVIEGNYFGVALGASGAVHRHLVMAGKPSGLTAANANVIRKNYFTGAVGGDDSTQLYYGTGNTFAENIWEANSTRALQINGGGLTAIDGNYFESNNAVHQILIKADVTITSTIYYNRVISFNDNVVNMLSVNNGYLFSLDANSYNLSMVGNSLYTNRTPVYVTDTPAGNNKGIIEYRRNSNYATSLTVSGVSDFNALNITGGVVAGSPAAPNATYYLKNVGAGTILRITNDADATALFVGNTGQMNTGVLADSPYNSTTASAANLVVLSNGVLQRSTSALKYKQDVRDLEHIDINAFRPVRYKSKCDGDDPDRDHFGVIADEVHAAGITELVSYGAGGEVEGFQYERLTVVLLKEIQTLRAEFDSYKASHP